MKWARVVVVLWVASLSEAGPVFADKAWPPAEEHFSDDHFYRFVISTADLEHPSCTGALERWDSRSPGKYQPIWARPLVNMIAPVDVVVDSSGRFVTTFDNWSSRGYGANAVVVYGPDGALVRAYSLLDLLLPAEIDNLSMSASSVAWFESATYEGAADRRLLEIHVRQEHPERTPIASIVLRIDPVTGLALRSDAELETIAEQKTLCQTLPASESPREWKACRARGSSDVWCSLCAHLRYKFPLSALAAVTATPEGQPLDGPEWSVLGFVTGVHPVPLKKAGLEARVVESGGSVARDPVTLFLVVTNNGSSDRVDRIWRVPRTVARFRNIAAAACGVDVAVDVQNPNGDAPNAGDPVARTVRKTLRLCFLSADRKLEPTLKTSELPAQ